MKIIAGAWKGVSLRYPKPALSRPTQERVKKSIFDILGKSVRGQSILDLFCGSGSLGIEALSRGARSVTFVEWNPDCIKLLKENLLRLRGKKEISLLEENVLKAIGKLDRKGMRFGVIFMDPPYFKGVTSKCLRRIGKYDILSPNAILVVRHAKNETLPQESGPLRLWRERRFGDTLVSFFK